MQDLKLSKSKFSILFLIVLSVSIYVVFTSYTNKLNPRYPVVIICMSGFRTDYLKLVEESLGNEAVEQFTMLTSSGIKIITPKHVFPMTTLSNLQSFLTGLYPNQHEIFGDYFYNKENKKVFDASLNFKDVNSDWIRANETKSPIWYSLEMNELRTASLSWPLNELRFKGKTPFKVIDYKTSSENLTIADKFEVISEWLTIPGMSLIMAYFDEPGQTAKLNGTNNEVIGKVIAELNQGLRNLSNFCSKKSLRYNLFLFSESTTIPIVKDERTSVENCISDRHEYRVFISDSLALIYLEEERNLHDNMTSLEVAQEIVNEMRFCEEKLTPYLWANAPAPLKLTEEVTSTTPDIVILPPSGHLFINNGRNIVNNNTRLKSVKGYSSVLALMNSMFILNGPSFRSKLQIANIEIVDFYQVICQILKVPPHPHMGSEQILKRILFSD